jgi:hypothetical protein
MESYNGTITSFYSCSSGFTQQSGMDACNQFLNSNGAGYSSSQYSCVVVPGGCIGLENSSQYVVYGWIYATTGNVLAGTVWLSEMQNFCEGEQASTWD